MWLERPSLRQDHPRKECLFEHPIHQSAASPKKYLAMTVTPRYAIRAAGDGDWHSKQVVGDE